MFVFVTTCLMVLIPLASSRVAVLEKQVCPKSLVKVQNFYQKVYFQDQPVSAFASVTKMFVPLPSGLESTSLSTSCWISARGKCSFSPPASPFCQTPGWCCLLSNWKVWNYPPAGCLMHVFLVYVGRLLGCFHEDWCEGAFWKGSLGCFFKGVS